MKKIFSAIIGALLLVCNIVAADGNQVIPFWNSDWHEKGLIANKGGGEFRCVSLVPTLDKCTIVMYQTNTTASSFRKEKIYGNYFSCSIIRKGAGYVLILTSVYPQPPYERTGAPDKEVPLFLYDAEVNAGNDIVVLRNMNVPNNTARFAWDGYTTSFDPVGGGSGLMFIWNPPLVIENFHAYVGGYAGGYATLQIRPIVPSQKGRLWISEYLSDL